MGFDQELLQEIDRIIAQYTDVHDQLEQLWAAKIVFTWHWWLDVALAILPWILWIIVRDKKHTHSLLYAGFFTMLMASFLCMAGVSQEGWNYNTMLLPYFPEFLPWDLTVMPVMSMLFYQFFPKINGWVKGIVFSAIASYVVEPIFIWLGLYEPSNWEHHYSFPIYLLIYMIGYWLYRKSRGEAAHRNHGEIRNKE